MGNPLLQPFQWRFGKFHPLPSNHRQNPGPRSPGFLPKHGLPLASPDRLGFVHLLHGRPHSPGGGVGPIGPAEHRLDPPARRLHGRPHRDLSDHGHRGVFPRHAQLPEHPGPNAHASTADTLPFPAPWSPEPVAPTSAARIFRQHFIGARPKARRFGLPCESKAMARCLTRHGELPHFARRR